MVERQTWEMQLEQGENQQRQKVDLNASLATRSQVFYDYKRDKEKKIDSLLSDLHEKKARLESELKGALELNDANGLQVESIQDEVEFNAKHIKKG